MIKHHNTVSMTIIKKIWKLAIATMVLGTIIFGNIAFAAITEADIDTKLLPRPSGQDQFYSAEDIQVGKLPKVDFPSISATAIKYVLSLSMVLTFVALIVAGIFYLTAQGEEEQINKAKDIIIYLIIGMAIIAASYAITIGISQFQFLS